MTAEGRRYVEDWGWLGSPRNKKRLYVRRIILYRPGEKDVILVTNLLRRRSGPGGGFAECLPELAGGLSGCSSKSPRSSGWST